MKKQYYNDPHIVIREPSDRTYAFTMRLTNFLLQIKAIKKSTQPNEFRTSAYASNMCSRLNLRN